MKGCQATSRRRLRTQAGKEISLSLFPPPAFFIVDHCRERLGRQLAPSVMIDDFIQAVAAEMASGVDAAVECWMTQVERALESRDLTTLGRLQAVREILATYKRLTGKVYLVRAVSTGNGQALGLRDFGCPDQT